MFQFSVRHDRTGFIEKRKSFSLNLENPLYSEIIKSLSKINKLTIISTFSNNYFYITYKKNLNKCIQLL